MSNKRATTYKGFIVIEDDKKKILKSPKANYLFNKQNGTMLTWGKTKKEDPEMFPAPTILDMEITTKCSGVNGVPCAMCYKSNTEDGQNMTFLKFKKIFDKLPRSITQIAFGADSTLESNPDIWRMMQYSRKYGIIPNVTLANVVNDDIASNLAKYCGAVAVSYSNSIEDSVKPTIKTTSTYFKKVKDDEKAEWTKTTKAQMNKDTEKFEYKVEETKTEVASNTAKLVNNDSCYNSIKKLTDKGMNQINMHFCIHEDSFEDAKKVINDIKTDERLSKLNALVFLSLKQKGRGETLKTLSQEKFNELVNLCFENDISIGFDSCSSLKFYNSLSKEQYETYKDMIMPCESTLESSYINYDGFFFPCSFIENTEDWKIGIDVKTCKDFITNVWKHKKVEKFRTELLKTKKYNNFGCRSCPVYKI